MKYLVCALLAALVTIGVWPEASAAPRVRDPRVPALQAQVVSLTKKIDRLSAQLNGLITAPASGPSDARLACRFAKQQEINITFYNAFAVLANQPGWPLDYPDDKGACALAGIAPPRPKAGNHLESPYAQLSAIASPGAGQSPWTAVQSVVVREGG